MNIKGQKTDFIDPLLDYHTNKWDSKYYKFIHPNIDTYFDHIDYICLIINKSKFIKYVIKTEEKGQYHYEYFKLFDLEREYINIAQGSKPKNKINENIPQEIIESIFN